MLWIKKVRDYREHADYRRIQCSQLSFISPLNFVRGSDKSSHTKIRILDLANGCQTMERGGKDSVEALRPHPASSQAASSPGVAAPRGSLTTLSAGISAGESSVRQQDWPR
jgi:hypothetical protein